MINPPSGITGERMKPKFKGTPGKWKTYKGNDRWVVRGGNIVAVVHDGKRDGSRGWEDQDLSLIHISEPTRH